MDSIFSCRECDSLVPWRGKSVDDQQRERRLVERLRKGTFGVFVEFRKLMMDLL